MRLPCGIPRMVSAAAEKEPKEVPQSARYLIFGKLRYR